METIKKEDFIEIEFTGKSDGTIFDTTNPEEAKSIGFNQEVKPIIISVGNEMLLKGFDESLEGKELNKKYSINLSPEKAFGKRNPSMIKLMPLRIFKEKNANPIPGATLYIDNHLAKILSVSGGRVTVDFNNPLAGKEIDYDFTIKRKVADEKEKINALQDFFFRQKFDFEIKDKKVIFKDSKLKPVINMFKDKFKDIAGVEIEIKEPKKEEKEKPKEPSKQ